MEKLNNNPSSGWLSMLADDSEATFKLIYDQYNRRIYMVALRYLKSEVLAQEVVQDVFMKLWTERKNIKAGTPVEAWLYTVAKNDTINRLKRIANERKAINYLKHTHKGIDDSTQDSIKDADGQLMMRNALKSLSTNQRKVFQMAREESLSYIEIAEQLGISPLTVKTHMSRALSYLKEFFGKY